MIGGTCRPTTNFSLASFFVPYYSIFCLQVGAIHQKRTVAFLNHFITHTVKFLNHFSCVCEEKLSDLAVKIQRLETAMSILESKVGNVHCNVETL